MNFRLLSLGLLLSTSAFATPNLYRLPAGQETCQANADTPLLFNVIKNSPEEIVVELGNFVDFFKLKKNQYNYSVKVRGVHQEKPGVKYVPKEVSSGIVADDSYKLTIPVSETGAYIFELSEDGKEPFWVQKVFSVSKKSSTLSEAQKLELAKKYSPILSFEDNEVYYPSSLEYITNQVDVDPALNEETFRIVNKTIGQSLLGSIGSFFGGGKTAGLDIEFKYKDLLKVLPFYGHHNSVLKYSGDDSSKTRLKYRFGEKHITVYYSIFESISTKEVIVNYHFLYPYDLKNGTVEKGVAPAHIFDRESMSISLNSQLKPNYVIFGAHLASQTMAQLNAKGEKIQEWLTGRVFVPWSDVNKINERPVASIAYGSHGVYPKDGVYGVMFNKNALLTEKAGGGKRFIHPEFNTLGTPAESKPYKLVDLKLESVVSTCKDARGILAYSGSVVDVLGPTNATFPPFTDREENFTEYLYPDIIFDMTKTEPTKY